jgi:glutamine---fructose-6-phosphate transaminase (isomerizing)
MCGIVGMVSNRQCAHILLDNLRRLEYRGYDSAGIATLHEGDFNILRSEGKLVRLAQAVQEADPAGTTGIGHTRWATHGRPSEQNAHPHRFKDTVVVHNGIIENYNKIKERLADKGHHFSSETDSEIIAHLIQQEYEVDPDSGFPEAVRRGLLRLHGSFAVAVMHRKLPDLIVVARHMSPLVVGLAEGESFVASDVPALLSCTRDVIFLEDHEMAVLRRSGISLMSVSDGTAVHRETKHVSWTPAMAEKGGFKHFMLKEMHEQPRGVTDTLRPRLGLASGQVLFEELDGLLDRVQDFDRVCIIACGTSYHAGLIGKWYIEEFARVPVDVEVASEFRYRNPLVSSRHLIIAVSQSGETADTLAAAKEAQSKGAAVVTICNVVDSSLPRMSDATIYTYAGPEIGVASTKAFTCQMAVLLLFSLWLAQKRGNIPAPRLHALLEEIAELPSKMEDVMGRSKAVQSVAHRYIHSRSMLYLGRGLSFPMALEGALKLKELSYIHAEGYPAGEMKHGPIALIDDTVPSVFIVPQGPTYEKTVSNIEEIKSRGGPVLAVAMEGEKRVAQIADAVFYIPECTELLHPFLSVLPLQLFSYYVADLKGTDVDQPRNLAKSVTVE